MKSSPLFVLTGLMVMLLGVSHLQAGTSNKNGNPFGNGTFYNTAGTFTGVLRGVNIVGVTQFSTSTNTVISGGALYVYNANIGAYDDTLGVYATLDPSSPTLTALIMPATANAIAYTNTAFGTGASNNLSAGGGYFSASLSTKPPNQTYSGNGNLTEVINGGSDPTGITNIPFVINGTRIAN